MSTRADTAIPALDFTIDRTAEVPIGVQLAWALRTRIRDGRLGPGQRLPGLRELAEATKINVNTARAVYQRLEHEGIIESLRGSGTFVAATAPPPRATAAEIAADAAREALRTGVDPREVAAALYVEPARSEAATSALAPVDDAQAARRQRLRSQIAALEGALVELEVAHPELAQPARRPRRGAGPRLLDAAELERTQTELIRRLAALQIAIDDAAASEIAAAAQRDSEHAPSSASAATRPRPARSRPGARPAPAGA